MYVFLENLVYVVEFPNKRAWKTRIQGRERKLLKTGRCEMKKEEEKRGR